MEAIRVMVVDDSTVIRRLVTEALSSDPEIEVVTTASNGKIALSKLAQYKPDLITMDIEMPEMDGLETLAELRKTDKKTPVIMFSTLTERGAVSTLNALTLGASDYVTKPANVGSVTNGIQVVKNELVPKVKALCGRKIGTIPPAPSHASVTPRITPRPKLEMPVKLLAIGTSTGGPNALAKVFEQLPKDLPVPVVVVQHMPPVFTRYLAERLHAKCALNVREAVSGTKLAPGTIWIAPGDFHLEVNLAGGQFVTRLTQAPPENFCRPAVDVLFRSVARAAGAGALAVVLTGMGQDGLIGCQAIDQAGGNIFVQDEETSVIWGMPGAVARANLANQILPLDQIAREISSRCLKTKTATPSLLKS
ncbi:MAG: chemotaxis response regulator protein-glutamate methylesterase [Pirellulales bacterium]